MNTKVKCRYCKEEIDKSTAYNPSGRLYFCNLDHYKKQCDKDKYKPSKKKKDGSPNERRQLTDYIQDYYISQGYDKHEINWQLIMAQIKNQIDEYGFKYSGMLLTLKYMVEIKEINLLANKSNSIVSLIPFEYNNAKNNWIETQNIKKELESFDFTDKEITIVKRIDNNNKKLYNSIDMDNL